MRLMSLTQTKTLCLTQNESWQLLVSLHVMMYACVLLQFHFIFACKLSCQLLESFHTHAHEKSKYPKLCFFRSILGKFSLLLVNFGKIFHFRGISMGIRLSEPSLSQNRGISMGIRISDRLYSLLASKWTFLGFFDFSNFPQLIQHFFWKMPKKSDFGLGF